MGYDYGNGTRSDLSIDLYSGLTHEIGHAIDEFFKLSENQSFKDAYGSDSNSGLHGKDMSAYKSGQSNVDNYSDKTWADNGMNTTKGMQEVAADLLSKMMGGNSNRPNDVSAAYQDVASYLGKNSAAIQFRSAQPQPQTRLVQ